MKFERVAEICNSEDGHEYMYSTALAAPPGAIVEIGVQFGNTSIFFCGAADEKNEHFYAIDPWDLINDSDHEAYIGEPERTGGIEQCARQNIAKLGLMNYTIFKNYSHIVAETFDKPVGFILIDGCHCTECVKKDFFLWAPKMVPGGIMVFHDAGFDTVGPALRHIVASPEFRGFHIVESVHGSETYVRNG